MILLSAIDNFYNTIIKRSQNAPDLSEFLRSALLGNRDSWLVFLDFLEEQLPVAKNSINKAQQINDINKILLTLSKFFPEIIDKYYSTFIFKTNNVANIKYFGTSVFKDFHILTTDKYSLKHENCYYLTILYDTISIMGNDTDSLSYSQENNELYFFLDDSGLYEPVNHGSQDFALGLKFFNTTIAQILQDYNTLKDLLLSY